VGFSASANFEKIFLHNSLITSWSQWWTNFENGARIQCMLGIWCHYREIRRSRSAQPGGKLMDREWCVLCGNHIRRRNWAT